MRVPRERHHPTRWFPSDEGFLMLNTDSSFSITGAGYGFVLQNHEANVLKSGAGPLSNITSEQHAEIMGLIVDTDC